MGGFTLLSLSGAREVAGSKELGAHFSPLLHFLPDARLLLCCFPRVLRNRVFSRGDSTLFCSLEQRAKLGLLLREGVLMLY